MTLSPSDVVAAAAPQAAAATAVPAAAPPPALGTRLRGRRWLLWSALVLLLLVAQTLLVLLTLRYESTRLQDAAEATASDLAAALRRQLLQAVQDLQPLAGSADWPGEALVIFGRDAALARVERRESDWRLAAGQDSPQQTALFGYLARDALALDAEGACRQARREAAPVFSRTYFVPINAGRGYEAMDLCMPRSSEAGPEYLVATFVLVRLLEQVLPARAAREYEVSLVEADGTRLAHSGARRGSGAYVGERVVDLPGATLQLRVSAVAGAPSVIPNLAVALVVGLSLALFAVVLLLARDVRRRSLAEGALADALAERRAMEDSLVTGLRVRDLEGKLTYANPAFCKMVGFSAEELGVQRPPRSEVPPSPLSPQGPPYWPPERAEEYARRQALRSDPGTASRAEAREGFESVYMRKDGERFPVMIYEAPLIDNQGRHTGWMGAVVDLTTQRRIEELSRQQQERLQASARLATVGEMASLMSHELNQPLAAIASYASGSLNLLAAPDAQTQALLAQALQRIAEQAERAGRVIKSVHDFVRRREHQRETLRVDLLFDAVMPLVRLQARKSGAQVEVDLPPPPLPAVVCDRTMVEQVLLNLTRNGIQAMEDGPPERERVLTLRARADEDRRVAISVIDTGSGITPAVAERLFTPFFTTRGEGMGLGLSLCRTVAEQHGGTLEFGPGPGGVGTEFRFTLAAPQRRAAAKPDTA